MSTPYALPLPDAARHVGVSERTLRDAINEETLHCRRVGKKIVIAVAELERWFEALPSEWARS